MPSIRTLYNDELVEAHREAVAALRELLAQETDPQERRKLANAILRARPAKETPPADGEDAANVAATGHRALIPSAPSGGMPEAPRGQGRSMRPSTIAVPPEHTSAQADNGAFEETCNDLDDDLGHPLDREIDELAHQLTNGPDPLAAVARLQAIMNQAMAGLPPGTDTAQIA